MRILLCTDNLLTRSNLENTWINHGAEMLSKGNDELPDLVVVDLNARDVATEIRGLRERYPDTEILAFGPHVDGEAFKQAKTAGASSQVSRGKVLERVLAFLRETSERSDHEGG